MATISNHHVRICLARDVDVLFLAQFILQAKNKQHLLKVLRKTFVDFNCPIAIQCSDNKIYHTSETIASSLLAKINMESDNKLFIEMVDLLLDQKKQKNVYALCGIIKCQNTDVIVQNSFGFIAKYFANGIDLIFISYLQCHKKLDKQMLSWADNYYKKYLKDSDFLLLCESLICLYTVNLLVRKYQIDYSLDHKVINKCDVMVEHMMTFILNRLSIIKSPARNLYRNAVLKRDLDQIIQSFQNMVNKNMTGVDADMLVLLFAHIIENEYARLKNQLPIPYVDDNSISQSLQWPCLLYFLQYLNGN